MATREDAVAVSDLVVDAVRLLDWFAGPEAQLVDEAGENIPVLPGDLRQAYAAAVDQLVADQVALALSTLNGVNDAFPMERVLAVLASAGWDGALRDFKLRVLERGGRSEVRQVTSDGRARGGPIRRAVLGPFMGVLNAALDSLAGVPGVAAIKELKDFLERILGRS